MKTTQTAYTVDTSDERIREILDANDQTFEELNSIPSADRLTYSNGFYVKCTALFIDIRGSSSLPQNHTRPVLAKIYRSYLSECVAILNQDENCREVFITGDCVSGIFDTPTQDKVSQTFFRAGQLNTMLNLLNWRLEQKGYTPINCGIGLDYGRALMLKAGYKGSGINEIIWMGDVVNNASNLCHQGNKGYRKAIQVSSVIHSNIRDDYKKLLSGVGDTIFDALDPKVYEGDLVATVMNDEVEGKKQGRGLGLAALMLSGGPSHRGTLGTLLTGDYPPPQGGLGLISMPRKRGLFDL